MANIIEMKKSVREKSLEEIAEKIVDTVGAELVLNKQTELGDGKTTALLILEDYYFRVKNYVTLTILLTDDGYYQNAVVVGSGGGDGFSNFSLGANKSIAKRGVAALEELGFVAE